MKKIIIRISILLVILAGTWSLFRFTPLGEWANLSRIAESRDSLLLLVTSNYILVVAIFIALYVVVVALSIPGATVLTLAGGFFFGPWLGTLYINAGATVGALLVFLFARWLLGKTIQEKYGDKLARFNHELDQNGSNYLLTLRLIPIFPFFLINLLASVTPVKARTFLWTTSLGIIPGSFVYSYLGYAGASLEPGSSSFPKEPLIALVLLGILSLVPVVIKKIKKDPMKTGPGEEQNAG